MLLVGATTSACGGSAETGDKGYVDGTGIVTRLPVDERKKPGAVSGETLDGTKVDLKQYAGKVVVLNVWGSWCGPCRKEARTLGRGSARAGQGRRRLPRREHQGRSPDKGLAFQRRYDVPYPSLFDPSGRTLLAFHGTLNPRAIPSTIVLDQEGRTAASILGEVPSQRTLVELVRDVAKGSAG